MARRSVPPTLAWLAMLIGLAVLAAFIGGVTLYVEARVRSRTQAQAITGGHVDAGRTAITRRGCGSCHDIPGITGASGMVGPPLSKIATRRHIAGGLPNDPETMIRWLMHPRQMRPGTAMPEQGLSEAEARSISAYLYTLD
ncbi:c-type cytochrome [Sphingomonas zeae]|jgi:cytochrome c2